MLQIYIEKYYLNQRLITETSQISYWKTGEKWSSLHDVSDGYSQGVFGYGRKT